MQGTYWLTVLPETSQLRPRIKRALRGVDDDARVTPTVDDRNAEPAGRKFGEKFRKGFERSGASKIGAAARLIGGGFKFASDQAGSLVRHVGLAATAIGVAARITKGFAASLLVASTGLKYVAGISLTRLGVALGVTAKLAGRLATQITRVTSAILVLSAVGKLLSFMNRAAKLMSILTIGTALLIGTVSALASVLGGALVAALVAVGSAIGVAAGAMVGLLGPAITVAKIGFKGLSEGAKAFAESMADIWGPADEEFNKMIGQRMGPLLTAFRDLRMEITDNFSQSLVGPFEWMGGAIGKLTPRLGGLATTMGNVFGEIAGGINNSVINGDFDKMIAASDRFFQNFLGNSGLEGLTSGLVAFAATAADTFAGTGKGINQALLDAGNWLRNINPAQMTAAFVSLKQQVMNVWNVLKPIVVGIRDIGAVSAPALAPGFKALGGAIAEAVPGLVRMSEILMPALSQVMERLAPVIPALVTAFTPWAGVLARIAPPIAEIVAKLAPLAPLLLVTVGAVKAMAIGIALYNTAMLIAANATKIWTAAQWLWNAAFAASGIGTIIVAVAALGVALWAFFTKTETGRKLWDKIWTGIKTTFNTVWTWLKTTLANAWTQIGPSVMKIGAVAKQAFGTFVEAVKQVWTAIQPAVAWLGRLWMSVSKIQFGVAIAALKALGTAISWLWTNVVVPAFQGIAATIASWWSGTQQVWAAAQPAISALGDVIMWLWNSVAVPAFNAISGAVTGFWDSAKDVWDKFTGALDFVGGKLSGFKDAFVTGFNAIKDVVTNVWNTIGGIIDKIGNGIGNVVDKLRGIPGLGSLIPGAADGKPSGFATGRPASLSRSGVVRGPGTGTSDSILAMISNDEGIVKASAMRGGGAALVAALNSGWVPSAEYLHGMVPGFAGGKGPDISVAEQLAGTPYSQGQRFDCSGTVARVINGALGADGGLMTTKNAREWLASRGFVEGTGGPGQMSVGWYDRGPNPNDGHMAMTLSDGRNAESGGKNGVFTIGAGAAGADDAQFDNHMYLPQMYGEGDSAAGALGSSTSAGGGGSFRSATSKELSASAGRVDTANTSLKNANQSVDDRTYARDKAQRRLDKLRAEGKDTADAQHSLDVANRELTDATERQTKAKDKATRAEQDYATLQSQGVEDASAAGGGKSSGDFGDLGSSLWGGLLETIGLDGSLFSNPFEWPMVKSAMAGVNFLGSMLSGGSEEGGAAAGGGAGGIGDLLGGLTDGIGLDSLNPGGSNIAAPATNVAPDTTRHGSGGGQAPGPGVYIENAGMSPTDVANKLTAEQNARTRTTKVH